MGRRTDRARPVVRHKVSDYYPDVSYRNGVFTRDDACIRGQCCSRESCCPAQYSSPRGRSRRDDGILRRPQAPNELPRRSLSCSTCSSCDSCSSDDFCFSVESFGSPFASTEASFYRKEIPHRRSLRQEPRLDRSPVRFASPVRISQRRGGSYADNLDGVRHRSDQRPPHRQSAPRRARSFTDCSSIRVESFYGNPHKTRTRDQHVYEERQMKLSRNTDSGIGRTSYSSGSHKSSGRHGSYHDVSPGRKAPRSRDIDKVQIIHKMASQTKEHRKLIKTLENELEKLRSGADSLSACEVAQKDVEWRPGDVVGEGSFSTVYKGAFCGTEVAVKELKLKLSQDDKNYFKSEAALLQQLHHPRVVLLMGVCTSAARPFMILEYLSGGTLHTLIHSTLRERLDHAVYFVIAKDIGQGMNFLHRHDPQVLHLDLKSMNVLLDGYNRAKIADFGFSILRRPRNGSAIQKSSIRGTPAYMAPELLTKGEVSTKCDVYSYAIIMWEMLTVSSPFKGLDVLQIMENVENGLRLPLPSSGVSQDLRELITSCWAHNPALRPSFEEILGALETASLPASWRNVLQRANIPASAFSDIPMARNIIDVVEGSLDILGYSQPKGRRHPARVRSEDHRQPYTQRAKSPSKKSRSQRTDSPNRNFVHNRGNHHIPPSSPRRKDKLRNEDRGNNREMQRQNISPRPSPEAPPIKVPNVRTHKITSKNSPHSRSIEESYFSGSDGSCYSCKNYDRIDNRPKLSPPRYRSPQRAPMKRSNSPPKRAPLPPRRERSPRREPPRNQSSSSRYGAMLLTSEQLLNQKQRLKPVKPSALRELDDLPQDSINDISLVLKKAINQRRRAHAASSKENWRSNDHDWSDWAT